VNTYLLTMSLRSGLGTALAADTLWGHVAWAIRYSHGEAALNSWLAAYASDEPPLILSDPFPAGFLPRPLLPPPPRPAKEPSLAELDAHKSRAKSDWILREGWTRLATAASSLTVLDACSGPQPAGAAMASVLHASINRLTGGTAQEGGGTLFMQEQSYFPASGGTFEVWLQSPSSAADLRAIFEAALAGGYGRDGASGLGHFTILGLDAVVLPAVRNANAIMTLAAAVPRRSDPARGFPSFAMRCGRLGGDFAIRPTPSGSTVRQKRPFHCLTRGSVLLTDQPQPRVGQLLAGVHEDPCIRHYAIAPTLPLNLDESLLREAR
jgi:CRISPR-associated protein Csm4